MRSKSWSSVVIDWRRAGKIFITEIFITTRNRMPATSNPSATIANIATDIVDAEVVVPAVSVVDALTRAVPSALSAASGSIVGRMDSVWVSVRGAVGS